MIPYKEINDIDVNSIIIERNELVKEIERLNNRGNSKEKIKND